MLYGVNARFVQLITVPSDHPFLIPNNPPVWFSGIPFAHLNNPLLVPILNAASESVASDTDSDSGAEVLFEAAERGGEGLWAGCSLGIVTGFQTRDNSARVTWIGGVELFSDEYAKKSLPSCVSPSSRYCNVSNIYFFFFSVARIQEMNNLRLISPLGRSKKVLCSASTARLITS